MMENLHTLTDSQIYTLCKQYGANARLWTRKFAGLLPEVLRRHLYKKKGYASIYEFSAKLGGMSFETVDRILRMAEKLQGKPKLMDLLETGTQGWSKIETVAYIATPERDEFLAEKVKNLTKEALQAYIKEARRTEEKFTAGDNSENNQPLSQQTDGWKNFSFPISPAVERKLRVWRQKIEKEKGETLRWNEIMMEIVKKLDAGEKKTVRKAENRVRKSSDEPKKVTRHIPTNVRREINERSERSCEFSGCTRAGEIYHHVKRFALEPGHHAETIVFLCKPHERLIHSGLIENEEEPAAAWKLRDQPDNDSPKFQIDEKVNGFRRDPVSLALRAG